MRHILSRVKNKKFKNDPPIIVAGLGRCGTTLVTKALSRDRGYKHTFTVNLSNGSFINRMVYKTHSYPTLESFPENIKVLFLFGDLTDIILSTTKKINFWGESHYKHLHSDKFEPNEDLFYKDLLGLENHFNKWYRSHKFPMMSIRYEALFDKKTLSDIESFLGFQLKLPAYKERSSKSKRHPAYDLIRNTYSSLEEKINNAEDSRIWTVNS